MLFSFAPRTSRSASADEKPAHIQNTSWFKVGTLVSTVAGAGAGIAAWAVFGLAQEWLPGWLRFVVAGGLFLLGPGAAVVWSALSGVALSRRVVLALGFGIPAAPLMAHILSAAGLLYLYPYIASGLFGAVVARSASASASAPAPRANLTALVVLAGLALALGYATYANRVGEFPDRTIYYGEYDTFDITYYAAIAAELTHTIPPESPFRAGEPLNHAFYPQLPVAMLHMYAGVPVLDTYFYYLWPSYLALAALMCFVFVESIASRGVAFVSALLLLVGSDLSYLAAWFYPRLDRWDPVVWSANFLSPSAETLLFNNWTPTLVVVFAGFYALAADERDPRRRWILAAGTCFALTAQFKPFALASLLAAIAAAMVMSWKDRAAFRRLLFVGAVVAVVSAPYVYRILTMADVAQAGATAALFTLPRAMMNRLSLETPVRAWAESLGSSDTAALALVGLVGTPLFLIGGLGFRLVGLPALIRCLVHPLQQRPIWRVLAWTIVAAIAAPFVIATEPVRHEAMHFHQFALFLLPIFVASAVMSSTTTPKRIAACALIVAVAVPSTFHYVHRKWGDSDRPHNELLADEATVAELLRRTDADRTVLLHNRPRASNILAIVAERRSVLAWGGYVRNSHEAERDVARFFRSADVSLSAARAVIDKYRPTHIVTYPWTERIHPALLAQLRPMFRSPDVVLFEVPEAIYAPP